MTLAEAIIEIERQFQVHREVGMATEYTDQDGQFVQDGPRNFSRAPNGERYVVVTSGGMKDPGSPFGVFFDSEDRAASWWLYAMEDYAETIAPKDQWSSLHLYWRETPEYSEQEYVAMRQSDILGNARPHPLNVVLGTVYSRLLISKLGPDGKEG